MPGNNVVDAGDSEERSRNRIFRRNRIYNDREAAVRRCLSGLESRVSLRKSEEWLSTKG